MYRFNEIFGEHTYTQPNNLKVRKESIRPHPVVKEQDNIVDISAEIVRSRGP